MSNFKKILLVATIVVNFVVIALVANYFLLSDSEPTNPITKSPPKSNTKENQTIAPSPEMTEKYEGKDIAVPNGFAVKVTNGWRASVSSQTSFLGVQFARPGQIESLAYNASVQPVIDYDGIPSWSGLTEHFYIRRITNPSQAFNAADHAEVTSEAFTFEDGIVGTEYSVTKHAAEAQKYGGLLKDSEWYGRVFVYTKGDATIEAHLAYYPSTKINIDFYMNVARSIKL